MKIQERLYSRIKPFLVTPTSITAVKEIIDQEFTKLLEDIELNRASVRDCEIYCNNCQTVTSQCERIIYADGFNNGLDVLNSYLK